MDEQTRESMKRVIDYLRNDESKNFEEQAKPENHIFRDVMHLEKWLSRTGK